jgi:hypothetical protein
MLYFLVPFCLALVTMAGWEFALFLRRSATAVRERTVATSEKKGKAE